MLPRPVGDGNTSSSPVGCRIPKYSRERGRSTRWIARDEPQKITQDFPLDVVFVSFPASSSCGSERAGHNTASPLVLPVRDPTVFRRPPLAAKSSCLALRAWSALHAIRCQGGPKVCPTNGPPLFTSSNSSHRLPRLLQFYHFAPLLFIVQSSSADFCTVYFLLLTLSLDTSAVSVHSPSHPPTLPHPLFSLPERTLCIYLYLFTAV